MVYISLEIVLRMHFDIEAQKIDGIILDTYEIVVMTFSIIGKANQRRFLKKIFLVANVSSKVLLGILFLTLSRADVDFLDRKL